VACAVPDSGPRWLEKPSRWSVARRCVKWCASARKSHAGSAVERPYRSGAAGGFAHDVGRRFIRSRCSSGQAKPGLCGRILYQKPYSIAQHASGGC
jgi:hypothetical protein